MKYSDIKVFPQCHYKVTIGWTDLNDYIKRMEQIYNADLNPDFQRDHVWTTDQQVKYCEYILRGGTSGRDVYCNCPGWMVGKFEGPYTLVDGKQRIEAVRAFLNNKIKVFNHYNKDFKGCIRVTDTYFNWHVAAIENRKELLEWYLNFNAGGTVHSQEELERVKRMINQEVTE